MTHLWDGFFICFLNTAPLFQIVLKKEMGEPPNLCCAAVVNTYEYMEHRLGEPENSPKISWHVEKSYVIIQESFI